MEPGKTGADGLIDARRVDAGLLGEGVCLGDGGDVDGDDHLVGKLGDVAGADLAHEGHSRSHGLEQPLVFVEDILLAAHHDGDGAIDGLGLATGNGSVEEVDADLLEATGESRLASGAMELMSMTHLPAERPSARPFGSKSALSTLGEFWSMVITTSAFSATSLPQLQAMPPSSTRSLRDPC